MILPVTFITHYVCNHNFNILDHNMDTDKLFNINSHVLTVLLLAKSSGYFALANGKQFE